MIIQTLLLPGCSFFNALPSLHLHMLLRSNPPRLALFFSTTFAILYLVDFIFSLAVCAPSSPRHVPHGLRRAECAKGVAGGPTHGVSKAIWDTMAAFELLSVVAYAVHAAMAWKVARVLRGRKERGEMEAVDPDEEEARRQKARDLWQRNYRMEGL